MPWDDESSLLTLLQVNSFLVTAFEAVDAVLVPPTGSC